MFKWNGFIGRRKKNDKHLFLCLSLTINVLIPVPEAAFIATVNFTFAQIIEFIKQYLVDYVVDVILASADAQMLLINLEKDVIENVIKPVKLPSAITSQINELNNKFDYARNLFKGYIISKKIIINIYIINELKEPLYSGKNLFCYYCIKRNMDVSK